MGMVLLNLPVAWYSTQVHQRGVVDVVDWLRKTGDIDDGAEKWDSAGFLMPCHSTGWRSSVVGGGEIWALSCEPPLGYAVPSFVLPYLWLTTLLSAWRWGRE